MFWTIAITALVTILVAVLAMNFKTSEKALERKIEHRYAVSDPQFRREMGVLLGPGIVPGNTVTDLENGIEIFPAMLEAIRGAQKTVTFETYIYWSGDIGQKFADALSERARNGVAVKVMIDWPAAQMEDPSAVDETSVWLHQYRPEWSTSSASTTAPTASGGGTPDRLHRRLCIAEHLDSQRGSGPWRDRFRVEGPVVRSFQALTTTDKTPVVLTQTLPAPSTCRAMMRTCFVPRPRAAARASPMSGCDRRR